jgi:hypothetical protein
VPGPRGPVAPEAGNGMEKSAVRQCWRFWSCGRDIDGAWGGDVRLLGRRFNATVRRQPAFTGRHGYQPAGRGRLAALPPRLGWRLFGNQSSDATRCKTHAGRIRCLEVRPMDSTGRLGAGLSYRKHAAAKSHEPK